jgi:hypothetical protein
MRTLLAAAFFGLVSIASSAAAPQYVFAFTVRVDDAPPVALNVSMPPGTSRLLHPASHLKVEIETPAAATDTSATIVKLIDESSGKPVVLHTARRPGPIGVLRSFSYAVCEGKAIFESPAQARPLECER